MNRTTTNQGNLWDAPEKDYRQRYKLPIHFTWDVASRERIDYDGYWEQALQLLPGAPADVIEVGCGDGFSSLLMQERGYRISGVDYNDRAIEFARIFVPEGEFVVHDIRLLHELEVHHGRFDAATCIEVIEHIPSEFHDVVIQGIHKLLRPQGCLVLSVPSHQMPVHIWHYQHFSLEEITSLLEKNGFKVVQSVYQHRVNPFTSYLGWRLISNRFYDIRIARILVSFLFRKYFNIAGSAESAKRYLVKAEKL